MPTREIKTTLAIDGEKQFKSAMDSAFRSMRVLGSEMKLNTAIFGDNATSMEGLTKKGEILGKEIAKQKDIVAAYAKAVEDSAAAYGESDAKTDAYRIKLNNASVALANLENEAASNRVAIDNWGKKVETTAEKTARWKNRLDEMDESLGKASKAVGAALAGIAAIGGTVAGAAKGIFDLTTSTGKFADELLTTSDQTGISAQALQEWDYAAKFIDTDVSTMTGSMAKMIKQMAGAKDGTGTAADAFKALGVSITDSSGQLLNSQTVFFSAIDALGKISNETERDALAMSIFGKSAQELNPLIKAGSDELTRLSAEAHNVGVVMSDETLTQFGALDDSMNVFNSTIDGVKNSLASALLPAMQGIIPIVQDAAAKFADWLRSDGAQTQISDLVSKITDLATNLSENLGPIVQTVIDGFNTVAGAIGWVIDNAGTLKDGAIALGAAFTGLKVAQLAVNAAQLIMNTVMAANPIGLVTMAVAALSAGIVLLVTHWDEVKATVSRVWKSIKDTVKGAVDAVLGWFTDLGTGALDAGENLIHGIWDGISNAVDWLYDKISGWVNSVIDYIKGLFGIHSPSKVMSKLIGKPMVQGMAEGITKNAGLVDKAMSGLMPDSKALNMAVDVTRRFNDVAVGTTAPTHRAKNAGASGISGSDMDRLADKISKAIMAQPAGTVYMDAREMGRFVRKLVPVT